MQQMNFLYNLFIQQFSQMINLSNPTLSIQTITIFRPLHQSSITVDTPLAHGQFISQLDKTVSRMFIFEDRLVCKQDKSEKYFLLNDEICFDCSIEERKIQFRNREDGRKETFQSKNLKQFDFFISKLQVLCPQASFLDKFEIVQEKSKRKDSIVYLVKEKSSNSLFIAKKLKQNYHSKQEISILRSLKHPNVIYFREYFITEDNQIFIVTDYEDGGTLLDIMQEKPEFTIKQKFKVFVDLLNGLEFLRVKQIVHRDLKPQNIFYSKKDGNYKIGDFGLSKKNGEKIGKLAGTPGYIAPQLFSQDCAASVANVKSDIYSMGLIFYEILTSQKYYLGSNPQEELKKNMDIISFKKRAKNAELSSLQYSLLQKMIRSNPKNRSTSLQILQSSLLNEIKHSSLIEYLSCTNPTSKKEEIDEDQGFLDSFWKLIKRRNSS